MFRKRCLARLWVYQTHPQDQTRDLPRTCKYLHNYPTQLTAISLTFEFPPILIFFSTDSLHATDHVFQLTYQVLGLPASFADDHPPQLALHLLIMSQTATCQIELDELPALERGRSLDQPKVAYAYAAELQLEDERYFADSSAQHSTTDVKSRTSSTTVVENAGIRIGKVFIQEKVLYLLGVSTFSYYIHSPVS
jgi:hypothetical protein